MIRNGDVELQAREEEIRFLKIQLGEEKRAIELLRKNVPNKRNCEQELVTVQIQVRSPLYNSQGVRYTTIRESVIQQSGVRYTTISMAWTCRTFSSYGYAITIHGVESLFFQGHDPRIEIYLIPCIHLFTMVTDCAMPVMYVVFTCYHGYRLHNARTVCWS